MKALKTMSTLLQKAQTLLILGMSISLFVGFGSKALQAQVEQTPQSHNHPHINYTQFHFMTFPSLFSYHVVTRVTQIHLARFVEQAQEQGIKLEFLNQTEYANLVHALSFRTNGFLFQGSNFIQNASRVQTRFFASSASTSSALRPFLRWNFENTFFHLDSIGLNRFEEKPLVYLQDIRRDPERDTLFLSLEFQTSRGEVFSIDNTDMGEDWLSVLFPGLDSIDLKERYPFIAAHIEESLWDSFRAFLDEKNIPKDRPMTLYLKDLSPDQVVFQGDWKDFQRINIGVLAEDEQGQLQDWDWIVAPYAETLFNSTYDQEWMQGQIILAFHTAAHSLVTHALFEPTASSEFLSISPTLLVNPNAHQIRFFPTELAYFTDLEDNIVFDKEKFIFEMATDLAGEIGQNMLPFSRDKSPPIMQIYNYQRSSASREQGTVLRKAYQGICLHLAYSPQNQCWNIWSQVEGDEWLSQLTPDQRATVLETVPIWLTQADMLARRVLTRHAGTWVKLARLLLQKSQLEASDLQAFYEGLDASRPLNLPVEEYNDVDLTLDLPEALRALGLFYSPVAYETDVFYRAMSDAFAFTRSNRTHQTFQVTRFSTRQDVFDELKSPPILRKALPWIRRVPLENAEGAFTAPYAQGLSPIYFEFLMSIFPDEPYFP